MKRVSYKNENSALFVSTKTERRYATRRPIYAVWLPLRVFERPKTECRYAMRRQLLSSAQFEYAVWLPLRAGIRTTSHQRDELRAQQVAGVRTARSLIFAIRKWYFARTPKIDR